MATVIKADGTELLYPPESGEKFTLQELQAAVGGLIEIVHHHNAVGKILIVNEEGLLLSLPYNPKASALAGQPLVGDAVLCVHSELE